MIVLFDWQNEKTPGKVSFQIEVRLFVKEFMALQSVLCYELKVLFFYGSFYM